MAQWSTYGNFDRNTELEHCCRAGHSSSFLLHAESSGRICLQCLSNLISDRSSFLIHRIYAIDEFLTALKDDQFSTELMVYHVHLLITPLSEAIGSSDDAAFSKKIMDAVLVICQLGDSCGKSLVEEFLLQITNQISNRSQWNPAQYHILHLLGLLLETYCQENDDIPEIKNERSFFANLISGLQISGAEFQGEVLYVLYKVASFQNGTEQILRHCPKVCEETIYALLKTDSDELRINSLALLNTLAERSVFKIKLSSESEDEGCRLPLNSGSTCNQTLSLANTFIEAMKVCLLSSDNQVQASALHLISVLYSDRICFQDELQDLVEGGILDYVVEVLRLSGDREALQSLALDVLILLSYAKLSFMRRFPLLIQTLIHVLEKTTDSPYYRLQSKILDLLSEGLAQSPGMLQTAPAEQLLSILSKLVEECKIMMDQSVEDGDDVRLPPTFTGLCSALALLIEDPRISLQPKTSHMLQTAASYAAILAAVDVKTNTDLSSLKAAVFLVHAVLGYNQRQILQNKSVSLIQGNLVEVCERYVLPALKENLDMVEDVDLILIVFNTFTLILRTDIADHKADTFPQKLALNKVFTLAYELLARFPDPVLKDNLYRFLGSLISRLEGDRFEDHIVNAFQSLPSDLTSLLAVLEQRIKGQEQLISAQHAIIWILYTSSACNDRLASEAEIIPSLEQHLLVNKGSTLVDSSASKQTLIMFIELYVGNKIPLEIRNISCSYEAEMMFDAILNNSDGISLLSAETPKTILRWFLQRDSLREFTMRQLFAWFTLAEDMFLQEDKEVTSSSSDFLGGKRDSEHLRALSELIAEEACGTILLVSLFHRVVDQGDDDGIKVVVRALTNIARMASGVGYQLLCYNFELSLLPVIHPQNVNTSNDTRKFCVVLLFQMLYEFNNEVEVLVERSWLDVANQCANLILVHKNVTFDDKLLPFLSLINLILFKSNEENCLVGAAEALACNRTLRTRLEDHILKASSECVNISQIDLISAEAKLLCGVLVFHLLWLRWSLKFHSERKSALTAHETPYIGFEACQWSTTEDCNRYYGTSVTCKELCQIVYNGPATLKVLSSACIAEIFSQLHIECDTESSDAIKKIDLPNAILMSITMTLQGSILEDLELVSRNASTSLFLILQSPALNPQLRRKAADNPWNRILVEHFVDSLSAARKDGRTCTCGRSRCYAAHVVLGVLRVTPTPEWVQTVFSRRILSEITVNLSEDKVSPVVICIFHELLLLKYLPDELVIKIRNLLQAMKKNLYDSACSLIEVGTSNTHTKLSHPTEYIPYMESDDFLQSALFELVLQSSRKPTVSLCLETDFENMSLYTTGITCISIIDKFMQLSSLSVE
ncbi:meiosis inhibitor protein 1 [Marchantia polymorpha subsp. ruderalis]|uniref:Protein PRD1 n=1 Tax=Marchantia polymorpha TaxID=3197 RepID=A0A2R6W0Y3_MARPO|nr:hypothetical protein MARPO_0195s0003 [Marchantia polymorpha]BBN03093.1 hypothetical protein Mp_2g20670 [Marchantia polymorpha subsp. ruderalis]|eukprot:PTQ27510.1 hypothetical protein MARPO_0195s0003 [Marchantia polymorpha]